MYAFDEFELDIEQYELRRAGQLVHVEPQVFDVLAYLVQHHDRVVTKDELIDHVWPDHFISDAALSSRLMAARKAIGDSGREQRLIKTLHGRGFRFVGQVTVSGAAAASETPPAAAPPTSSFDGSHRAFPIPSTPLIGREQDVEALVSTLRDPTCRLVALTGPGGVGKTRLAIEVAHRLREEFRDGAAFVDLQGVGSGAVVPASIAEAAGHALSGQGTPHDQLLRALRSRELLLIVDNLEHVLDQATLLGEIVAEAPGIRILVTSREVLGLDEVVYEVKPLSVRPALGSGREPDAIRLFSDRARRASRGFDLVAEREGVEAVCNIVGGLPLALELAAAWVPTMACSDIAREIGQNIDFLTSNRRDISERHRSMTAVCDYSWGLMSEHERRTFARLCLFPGGFSNEAAKAVVGADLRTLLNLVHKSLVRFRGGGRYDVHELLRQYGEARLAELGELEQTREAHAHWFFDVLEQALPGLAGADQAGSLARLEADLDNLRAAWRWVAGHRQFAGRSLAIQSFAVLLRYHSWFREGAAALREAVEALPPEPASPEEAHALVTALSQLGWFSMHSGQYRESLAAFKYAVRLLDEHSLTPVDYPESDPAHGLAMFEYGRSNYPGAQVLAQQVYERSVAAGGHGNRYAALSMLGRLMRMQQDLDGARRHLQLAHELALRAGDDLYRGRILYELGLTAANLSDFDASRSYFEAALARAHDPQSIVMAQNGLAGVALWSGANSEALGGFIQVVAGFRSIQDDIGLVDALHGLVRALIRTGQERRAAAQLREALTLAPKVAIPALTGALLIDTAEIFLALGRWQQAAELLGVVETFPAWGGWQSNDFLAHRAALEQCLGTDALASALAAGRAIPPEEAVRQALAELVIIEEHAAHAPAAGAPWEVTLRAGAAGAPMTVLFTDLESSTALTQQLGDDAAQELLRTHNRTVRGALQQHGGREVKHTGDGIMARFASAAAAVRAALQIQGQLAGLDVRVRVGLNAGEPIEEEDDLFGTAVQLAARICGQAAPGQVLVSNVVKELCAGKGFAFEPLGDRVLKGFAEPVTLFAVDQSRRSSQASTAQPLQNAHQGA